MMAKRYDLPLLPLRDIVVFPKMIIPLFVGRDMSVKALEKAVASDRKVLLVSQKDFKVADPKRKDLYGVGVVASVVQLLKLPDKTVKVLVEGECRFKLSAFRETEDGYEGSGAELFDRDTSNKEIPALSRTLVSIFEQYIEQSDRISPEVMSSLEGIEDPAYLADTVASYLSIKPEDKQEILEKLDLPKRMERVCTLMDAELTLLKVEGKIRDRVKGQMERNQREYYLNEQLKAIHKELGDDEAEEVDEFSEFSNKIRKTKLSEEAKKKAETELKKLRNMSPMASEATVIRNYLEWLLSLPWDKPKKFKIDLKKAQKVLDEDHDALEKVKESILEHLAVQSRTNTAKGQIICLVGPPGVGKTSLASSIARATGRDFVMASLGGVKDESEIRGHRRTYIGSMPGRIIQSMKKAASSNPVFLLDEVDKLGSDWKGDPSSALLEVLDPQQNNSFSDHYLEVDYDLSKVMFIVTANTMNMPQPLLDRMEIIRLSGYTEQEKVKIAQNHLINRSLESHGVSKKELVIKSDVVAEIIRYYTRESGVRNLQREFDKIARKAVRKIVEGETDSVTVTKSNLKNFLGTKKFSFGEAEKKDLVGITTGLAWTEVGGELLQIEAVIMPGKGKFTMTGKLGDVMQESGQAAYSYIRSQAFEFGIAVDTFEGYDIHVHVPEGATPKDGPSAGVAMCTSIVSTLTGIPVRRDVAMTGEISLRGRVLPIGGLKEKLLAALRGGLKKVLIPKENEKDLMDIPEVVKKGLTIVPVDHVSQVIEHALSRKPKPLPKSIFVGVPPKKNAVEAKIKPISH